MSAVTGLAFLSAAPAPVGADAGEPKLKAAREHKREGKPGVEQRGLKGTWLRVE